MSSVQGNALLTAAPSEGHEKRSRRLSLPFMSMLSPRKPVGAKGGSACEKSQAIVGGGPAGSSPDEYGVNVNILGEGDTEVCIGKCICCGTSLKFPPRASCFRCTVCSTVNDVAYIQPAGGSPSRWRDASEELLIRGEDAAGTDTLAEPKSSLSRNQQPLSLAYIKAMAYRARTVHQTMGGSDDSDGNGAWRKATEALANVFSSASVLNKSFPCGAAVSVTDPGIAFPDLRQAYSIILRMPPLVQRTVWKAIEHLLRRPRVDLARPDNIRFLLILLEHPLLGEKRVGMATDAGKSGPRSFLKNIFGLIGSLPNDLHHYFVNWLCCAGYRDDTTAFRRLVELVNVYITRRLAKHRRYLETAHETSWRYDTDWTIQAAIKTMALLWAANLKVPRLQACEFYSTMVDMVDLSVDFERWTRRSSRLSFCQYPFILSMWAKMTILEYDSRRQMQLMARDSFFSSILTRNHVEPHLLLKVRRHCVTEDSLTQIAARERDLKRSLRIEFSDEVGVDAGGLRKEWFLLVCRDIFNARNSMFTKDDESCVCWFNAASSENTRQFYLVGVFVGLAIYNSTTLDVPLPLACYKKLMGFPVGVEDLAQIRPGLAKGLSRMMAYAGSDFEDVYSLDFTITVETGYGARRVEPLIPRGARMAVTRGNRHVYVERVVEYILNESVVRQFEPFKRGFLQACGGNALSLFRPEEIELMVRGSSDSIDVAHLRAVTSYDVFDGADPATEPVIQWFWQILASATSSRQRQIIQFITGCERVPVAGPSSMDFSISVIGNDDSRYPIAHTCFNQLCLFRYGSHAMLERRLERAILETDGFGLK